MNILEIKNFSKTYKGNKKAVDNLSITVEAGDIYGQILLSSQKPLFAHTKRHYSKVSE